MLNRTEMRLKKPIYCTGKLPVRHLTHPRNGNGGLRLQITKEITPLFSLNRCLDESTEKNESRSSCHPKIRAGVHGFIFAKKLDVGQVLVKVEYSGICGSQIGEIDGVKGEDKFLPHLLGHEGSGCVVEIGAGVRKVSKNDKVVLHWKRGSGIESNTPSYISDIGEINAGWVTTFNQYAVVLRTE